MRKLTLALAALTMAASFVALRPTTALAEEDSSIAGWRKGCWFYEGNPPACDICADNCNPYQKCCWIIAF